MARKVFTSFHFKRDYFRANQVRNMGKIEGNSIISHNAWETVKAKGSHAITEWIDNNMKGKSCLVVLVGAETSNRKWVLYEIEKAWNDGKGVLGIYVHKLGGGNGQDFKGQNPFDNFLLGGRKFSNYVNCHSTRFTNSTAVYNAIKENINDWIEEAIAIRKLYSLGMRITRR